MATAGSQDYKTHRKFVPLYHYVATGLLVAVLVWSIARMIGDFSVDRLMMFLLVVVVLLIGYFARTFPLGTQDRIIRLEERLRMWKLLPDDLKPLIESFTAAQLVALRFASDEELPELARKVRDEKIDDREAIKKLIKVWRADHQRI